MPDASDIRAQLGARRKGHSLPQPFYCDPGIFQTDLTQVFYREWLFAIPACQLQKPGDDATSQVGAYPVILVRGADGMIRAFHNVCGRSRRRSTML